VNLAVWVERHGRRRPDDPALADGDRVHAGWGVFAARTVGAAAGLRGDFGLSPGNRVAIVMRNRPEYLEPLFAIWHAGLVAVPVNARLHRDEIAYILDHSESAIVVTDDDHAGDVEPLVGTVASLQATVVAPGERWDRLTASSPAPLVGRQPDDPAWLFYTSGTTGRPKGATLGLRPRHPVHGRTRSYRELRGVDLMRVRVGKIVEALGVRQAALAARLRHYRRPDRPGRVNIFACWES
jgi:acyl-CoA synthetase (AMP-forming)/AMP-acid ligase II